MENGNFLFFLKPIYRIMTDSNFFNKSCPIFDNNMVSIALFCRFLPFFLQSEPQIGQIPTLDCWIDAQALISAQAKTFPEINKRTGPN